MLTRVQAMIDSIAFTKGLGMELEECGPPGERGPVVRVRLPGGESLANIAGSVHAGASFCVAETAAGIAAWCLRPGPTTLVLLRESTVRYTRQALGELVAEAEVSSVQGEVEGTGRAEVLVSCDVVDSDGEAVLVATFSYALRSAEGRTG